MQSPLKQPFFTDNTSVLEPTEEWDDSIAKPIEGLPRLARSDDAVEAAESSVASTIKSDEADEPLLRENPNRFVLFPIKYHEVRDHTRAYRVIVLPPSTGHYQSLCASILTTRYYIDMADV